MGCSRFCASHVKIKESTGETASEKLKRSRLSFPPGKGAQPMSCSLWSSFNKQNIALRVTEPANYEQNRSAAHARPSFLPALVGLCGLLAIALAVICGLEPRQDAGEGPLPSAGPLAEPVVLLLLCKGWRGGTGNLGSQTRKGFWAHEGLGSAALRMSLFDLVCRAVWRQPPCSATCPASGLGCTLATRSPLAAGGSVPGPLIKEQRPTC